MDAERTGEKQTVLGRFNRLAAWKKVGLLGGGFVVILFLLAFLLALFPPLARRASVMNSLAGGYEAEAPAMGTAPAAYAPAARVARERPSVALGMPEGAPRPAAATGLPSLETWDRQLILTAALGLEVRDVRAAYDRVQMVAAAEGALVTAATLQASQGAEGEAGYGSANVVLRMPQSRFYAVRQRLLALAGDLRGRVLKDEVSSEDVTEEYVDLQARLRNWRSQEAQLLEVMRQARRITDILSVRDKLFEVQQEIERLSGRLRFLQNRVDLATITVEISQKGAPPVPVKPTIASTLKNAGKAVAAAWFKSLNDVVYVFGLLGVALTYVLPFAVIAALIWMALRARRRAVSRAPTA